MMDAFQSLAAKLLIAQMGTGLIPIPNAPNVAAPAAPNPFQDTLGWVGCSLSKAAIAGYDINVINPGNHKLAWSTQPGLATGQPPYDSGGGAIYLPPAATTTGNTTKGSNVITNVASFTGITGTNQYLFGALDSQTILPRNNPITNINSGAGTITVTNAANQTATGTTLNVGPFGMPGWGSSDGSVASVNSYYWSLFRMQGMASPRFQPQILWIELCESFPGAPAGNSYTNVSGLLKTLQTVVTTPLTRWYISPMTKFSQIDYCPTENSNGANPNVPPFTAGDGKGFTDTNGWAAQAVADASFTGLNLGPTMTVDTVAHGVGTADPFIGGPGSGLPYCDPTTNGSIDYGKQLAAFFDPLYAELNRHEIRFGWEVPMPLKMKVTARAELMPWSLPQ